MMSTSAVLDVPAGQLDVARDYPRRAASVAEATLAS